MCILNCSKIFLLLISHLECTAVVYVVDCGNFNVQEYDEVSKGLGFIF